VKTLFIELLNGEIFTTLREAQVLIESSDDTITITPSGPTRRLAIDRRHHRPSCRQPVACLTLRFGQPSSWPNRPVSNS
jgi:hypothetical protein